MTVGRPRGSTNYSSIEVLLHVLISIRDTKMRLQSCPLRKKCELWPYLVNKNASDCPIVEAPVNNECPRRAVSLLSGRYSIRTCHPPKQQGKRIFELLLNHSELRVTYPVHRRGVEKLNDIYFPIWKASWFTAWFILWRDTSLRDAKISIYTTVRRSFVRLRFSHFQNETRIKIFILIASYGMKITRKLSKHNVLIIHPNFLPPPYFKVRNTVLYTNVYDILFYSLLFWTGRVITGFRE